MGRFRRLLVRFWHGSLWNDRGPWSYTTATNVVATQGPVWPRPAPPPPPKVDVNVENAKAVCAAFGHTLHRGWCVLCHELVGEVTVDMVLAEDA